jgi:hypothetical protein
MMKKNYTQVTETSPTTLGWELKLMWQCFPIQIFYIKCTLLYSTKYTVYLHGCVIVLGVLLYHSDKQLLNTRKYIKTADKHLHSYPSILLNKHCHWEVLLLLIQLHYNNLYCTHNHTMHFVNKKILLCGHKLPSIKFMEIS